MKKIALLIFCFVGAAFATPCEEVIDTISQKILKNGVQVFTLEAVDKGAEVEGKVVGVCGEGTKDIIYVRSEKTRDGQTEYRAADSE
ncbi:MAG: DUF1161 domain-containing protein [Helicobacteraceae bacterium]|jgi:hypothetical protein|nr:DUF1161 domain-containing protein [Helicobacteraceae bacterium]